MPRIIKQASIRVCEPCQYHECIGQFCVRQGPGGWREFVCKHPKANESLFTVENKAATALLKRLDKILNRDGRYIGKTDKQPDWCPLEKPK